MKKELAKTENLLKLKVISLACTTDGERLLLTRGEKSPLRQSRKLLRKIFLDHYGVFLNAQQLQNIIEYLEIHKLTEETVYEIADRIFNGNDIWAYELERKTERCVVITPDELYVGNVPGVIFKYASDFQDQIEPDWDIEKEAIFGLVHEHFSFKNKRQEMLFLLYLITSFWGLNICHPLLILTGEKGSSKSTTMRKLERLIDPKKSDLCGLPKGADGLELRLSNSYFVGLDNLSGISRNVSDTIARAVTGGSVTKRELYENTKEIVLNIKAVVAINGVSLVARESDLLDRSLILELKRIEPRKIKCEEELWRNFERDRPRFLGCIFQILAEAMYDEKEVNVQGKIRLADFHIACVKVGRVLGMSSEEVSDLLWENQRRVSQRSIDEDMVACCLVELMSRKNKYVNSVTGLLHDLGQIAARNSIVSSTLPKTPNHLSNRLSKVRSNLQAEYGITYDIANVGAFKQITVVNQRKVCESCESATKTKKKKK